MQKGLDAAAAAKTPRRGRPRAFDRAEALARATHVFWQKGYEATSILDLMEAMGIGTPSLYAAFGSKEELYAEALQHYARTYEGVVFNRFRSARTAREAVAAYLSDSAAALTGSLGDVPRGCMAALSFVDSSEHPRLNKLMRSARRVAYDRLHDRVQAGVEGGDLPASVDVPALARFIQNAQSGMSILARDGASQSDLQDVAVIAMIGWDGFVSQTSGPSPQP